MVRRAGGLVRRHPLLTGAVAVLALVVGAATWFWWTQLRVEYVEVSYAVPTAPRLVSQGTDDVVYRIDASRSSVAYETEERLAGVSQTARGTTSGIAGDVRVDRTDPSATEVGEIVVNVAQLTSDESIRDQRLQHDFLEAQDHPLATFTTDEVVGLPDELVEGEDVEVELVGQLTVKETTAPTTLSGTARIEGDELHLEAVADVKMSTFDIGPISVAGLVTTADDVRLTFDVVAVDVTVSEAPTLIAAPDDPVVATGEGPSYAEAVQPVIERSCASCHAEGEIGGEHWRAETAADVAGIADGLDLMVESGYMPPWQATDLSVPFQHDPSLSDGEIAALADWARAGGPLDVDPETPLVPAADEAEQVDHDLVVALSEPYQGSVDVTNDYRCFVLDPGFTEPTAIVGYEFLPDKDEILHHATVFRAGADRVEGLAAADAADDGPGWTCYTGTGADEQFAAWAPGQDPTRFPEGSAMRWEPGDVAVIQVHYHFTHSAPPDQSAMAFELADGPPEDYDELAMDIYLGPAEIPCEPEDADLPACDRDTVREQIREDFGFAASFIGDMLLRTCDRRLEDVAVLTDGRASASCDHRIRTPGEIIGVGGHMHEYGDLFRLTLNPDTPEEVVLLDIEHWDFSWQRGYELVTPIQVDRDDVVRMECTWDRSLRPELPPRWITWAEGTEDEMCYMPIATRTLPEG